MALHFELVTPARLVRSEDVYMVVVPGTEGEFGVLEGHAPVMATIRDGAVKVFREAGAEPESIEVRLLVSARNSGDAWDLRCALREHMLAWLRDNRPDAVARRRFEPLQECAAT